VETLLDIKYVQRVVNVSRKVYPYHGISSSTSCSHLMIKDNRKYGKTLLISLIFLHKKTRHNAFLHNSKQSNNAHFKHVAV